MKNTAKITLLVITIIAIFTTVSFAGNNTFSEKNGKATFGSFAYILEERYEGSLQPKSISNGADINKGAKAAEISEKISEIKYTLMAQAVGMAETFKTSAQKYTAVDNMRFQVVVTETSIVVSLDFNALAWT